METVIVLTNYTVTVTYDIERDATGEIVASGGGVNSNFRQHGEEYTEAQEAAYDAIESLVLGHACAGVDVGSAAYREGLQTAIDGIGNHLF